MENRNIVILKLGYWDIAISVLRPMTSGIGLTWIMKISNNDVIYFTAWSAAGTPGVLHYLSDHRWSVLLPSN